MKTLNLSFKGSLGKGHSLKLKYANDQLDEATVRNAMQKIVDSHSLVRTTNNSISALHPLSTSQPLTNQFSVSNKHNKEGQAFAWPFFIYPDF